MYTHMWHIREYVHMLFSVHVSISTVAAGLVGAILILPLV